MILLLDIGNTRVKWARYENGQLGRMDGRVHGHEQFKTALEAALEGPKPERVVVCNVAGPLVNGTLTELCRGRLGLAPQSLVSSIEQCGVKNGYADPARLGADRWAAIIGAFHRFGGPACVIDAGTAITMDALDAGGQHLGGLIAPGPQTMRRALAGATAGLTDAGEGEFALLCRDTKSAISSGGWHAAAGFLERMHALAGKRLGPDARFILTGGDGPRLNSILPGKFTLCPELVLVGLAVVAEAKP